MRKYYRKPHRYKKRKPLLSKKFLAFGFLALIVFGVVFYGLFFWQVFWVEKVAVSGEQEIAKADIESLIGKNLENVVLFLKTKSILMVNGGQIEKDILNAFPQIASAEVKKSFFDTISVQITERTAVALWCENEKCFLVDNEGVIFKEAPVDSSLLVIKRGEPSGEPSSGEAVLEKDKLAQILELKSQLTQTAKISIDNAVVSDGRLDIETSEGWQIRFNLKGDLAWQMTELKLALEKQISPEKRKSLEYIDLRFSRVYYK
ncbi:MAG: Cell division protein FtsQ [Parcubacteria group bacterium GW2011_GWF2_43_11]|nr:MAG: Cell division protein FtsQ [Parcubacteria group bacterium GW2011_GWF2_43_11]